MQRNYFIAAIGIVSGLALYLRSSGLDPPSLWLDDQWVGITVTRMSWSQFFALRPPVPFGFIAVSKLVSVLVPDPELALQLLPVISGIALVPALAILVTRLTALPSLGLLAGVLIAICPNLVVYSVAVKQYSVDALSTVCLLLLGLPLLDRWSDRRALVFAAASLSFLVLSFASVFVSAPLLASAVLFALIEDRERGGYRWQSFGVALGYGCALAVIYSLVLGGQRSEELESYWSGYFMPLDSVGAAWQFASANFPPFVVGALPDSSLGWMLPLVGASLVVLVARRKTRRLGLFGWLFYLQVLASSALHLYPLGTGRTDIFSYPVTLSMLCLGLGTLAERVQDVRIPTVFFLAVAVIAVPLYAERARYGVNGGYREEPCRDAELVARLPAVLREDDALLVYPLGAFAVGYYGPWELDTRVFEGYAHGFEVNIRRDFTRTLPGCFKHMGNPDCLEPFLAEFFSAHRGRPRVVLYASFLTRRSYHWLVREIESRGYVRVGIEKAPKARIITYVQR